MQLSFFLADCKRLIRLYPRIQLLWASQESAMTLVCLIIVINKRGIVNDHVYVWILSHSQLFTLDFWCKKIIEMRYIIYTRDQLFLVKNYSRYSKRKSKFIKTEIISMTSMITHQNNSHVYFWQQKCDNWCKLHFFLTKNYADFNFSFINHGYIRLLL